MTRPAPRTTVYCRHPGCGLPILRTGLIWVHDTPRRERWCIVASRYTGTVAEPAAQKAES